MDLGRVWQAQECHRRPGSGQSTGPRALPLHLPSGPEMGKPWTSHHLRPWMGDGGSSFVGAGWVGTEKEVSNSARGTRVHCREGGPLPDQKLGFAVPHLDKASDKIQRLLPLTKSATSSFFPAVLPESFPDTAGRRPGARSLASAALQVPSPCRNLRGEGGDIMR